MALASVLGSATVRVAFYGAAVLAVSLAIGAATVLSTLRTTIDEEVRNQIKSAQVALIETYEVGGREAILGHARSRASRLGTWRQTLAIYDTEGQRLAGNTDIPPGPEGWYEIDDPALTAIVGYPRILVNVSVLKDLTVVLGRSLETRDRVIRVLTFSLAGLALFITIVFLGIGIVVGSRIRSRIRSIGAALERVSQGDFSSRVPIEFGIDDIDRLAAQLNGQLARIESLNTLTRMSSSILAHELRTPLSRAKLAIERAACEPSGEDVKELLAEVDADLDRIGTTFDAVLNIARIRSQTSLEHAQIDPAALLAEMVEIFAPVAEDRGIRLQTAAPRDLNLLRGDVSMLRQMVANLIENALEYCPAGATITLSAEPRNGGRVALVVADTGPGIRENERSSVTELFYRIDADRAHRGAGLGLFIVQAIAACHAARLGFFDNQPGLRVEVEFPPP